MTQRLGLISVIFIGMAVSALALIIQPLWFAVVVSIALLWLIITRYPEIGLLLILVATSSIVFENKLPLIPIGIGSLHIPDVILLWLFLILSVRMMAGRGFQIVFTPLNTPIMMFYFALVLSTFYGALRGTVDLQGGIRAIRVVTYYLTFFLVVNLVQTKPKVLRLLHGINFLGIFIALAMLTQAYLGSEIELLPGRVEELQSMGATFSGVTRILPPGQSILLAVFILQTIRYVLASDKTGRRWIRILIWFVLLIALIVTFTRTFWVQILIGMGLLYLFISPTEQQRMIRFGMILILLFIFLVSYLVTFPEMKLSQIFMASYHRFQTVFQTSTIEEPSLQWRTIENGYGFAQFIFHPVWGLGLGARYRPFDPRLDDFGSDWDARKYMHNGHLWILVQGGLISYLCFLWLSYVFIKRSIKLIRHIEFGFKPYALGFLIIYIVNLIGAFVNPVYFQWYWTPLFGIILGLNETFYIMSDQSEFADKVRDTF